MITQPTHNNIHCPNCLQLNALEDVFCTNCGELLDERRKYMNRDSKHPTQEDSLSQHGPRQRPSLAQQCPSCGTLNRAGVLLCEACGTNLSTGQRAPLSTRMIGEERETWEDLPNVPIDGADTLDVEQFEKPSKAGSGVFDERKMLLRIQVDGQDTPLLLRLSEGHQLRVGRREVDNHVDIDLAPYDGYGKGISRRHMSLDLQDRRLEVWDLHSSNGTYLNGIRLDPNHRHQLRDGDELRLGRMVMRIFFQHRIER